MKILFLNIILIIQLLGGESIIGVSMINLIANGDQYDQKHVRIKGFCNIGFEVNGIYLSSLDYKYSILKNALWISLDKQQASKYKKNNKKYVIIEGIFNYYNKGHGNMYSGTIEKVNRLDKW